MPAPGVYWDPYTHSWINSGGQPVDENGKVLDPHDQSTHPFTNEDYRSRSEYSSRQLPAGGDPGRDFDATNAWDRYWGAVLDRNRNYEAETPGHRGDVHNRGDLDQLWANREQFRPKSWETPQEWAARVGPLLKNAGVDLSNVDVDEWYKTFGVSEDSIRQDRLNHDTDLFLQEMDKPIDEMMKDPSVQRLVQNIQGQASARNSAFGLTGASEANTQRAIADAQTQVYMQRKGLAAQVRGGAVHDALQLQDMQERSGRADQEAYNAASLAKYNDSSNLLRTFGGVGGGIIGGIAGAYVGGPMGAAAGAGAGSQLGAGLAGMGAGPAPTPGVYQSPYKGGY